MPFAKDRFKITSIWIILCLAVGPEDCKNLEVIMMARISSYAVLALLAISLMVAPGAVAGGDEHRPGAMKEEMAGHAKSMKEHHEMMYEIMKMMRTTMHIVRNFSERPTPRQKRKLDEMVEQMDDILKRYVEVMKKHEKHGARNETKTERH